MCHYLSRRCGDGDDSEGKDDVGWFYRLCMVRLLVSDGSGSNIRWSDDGNKLIVIIMM